MPHKYPYPKEYREPKPIQEQVGILSEILGLNPIQAFGFIRNLPQFDARAEGYFAIPSIDGLANNNFPQIRDPAEKYCRALQLILEKLGEQCPLVNNQSEQMTPEYWRMRAQTALALKLIANTQGQSDILIIAAQLGQYYGGLSVYYSQRMFLSNEFGLDSVAAGAIILTHPKRAIGPDVLNMDCVGDEFSAAGDDNFCQTPHFDFGRGKIDFGVGWYAAAADEFGSATGFLPPGLMFK